MCNMMVMDHLTSHFYSDQWPEWFWSFPHVWTYFVKYLVFLCTAIHSSNISFQAYVVLGQFLVLKKNEELFKDWLKETCNANAKQQANCYECLKEWSDAFLWASHNNFTAFIDIWISYSSCSDYCW